MEMRKLYNIKNLFLNYGVKNGTKILKDLTLEIPSGLISLIGPNGAGKTSFLRVLAGLQKNYSGSVKLNGLEVKKISRKNFAHDVSFVMSNKNFRPSYSFTVREIIELGRLPSLKFFGRLNNHDNELVEKSAELLKISHLLTRDIMTLSDGERQLVFIAAGIAQDTEIILLDEPTASLDPDKSAMIFALLKKLSLEGKNIIAAVHDINIASEYTDFYIAIKDGELIFSGKNLNQKILSNLYGAKFIAYSNKERNDLMWKILIN